jgi:hypothetical protein
MSEYNNHEFNPEPSDNEKEEIKHLGEIMDAYRARLDGEIRGHANDAFLLNLIETEELIKESLVEIARQQGIQQEQIEQIRIQDPEWGQELTENLEDNTKKSVDKMRQIYEDFLDKAPPGFTITDER